MGDTEQRGRGPGRGALQRMDHVSVVVDDLAAAIAFFLELGLELEGEMTVEGRVVDLINGLDGVRSDIAMMRTPDGHSRLELSRFPHAACRRRSPERPGERPRLPPHHVHGGRY